MCVRRANRQRQRTFGLDLVGSVGRSYVKLRHCMARLRLSGGVKWWCVRREKIFFVKSSLGGNGEFAALACALISALGENRGRAFWLVVWSGRRDCSAAASGQNAQSMIAATMPLASGLQVRVPLPNNLGTAGVVGAA